MAQPSNLYDTYDTTGIREDLVDVIYISTLNNTHKILVEKAFKSNKKIL